MRDPLLLAVPNFSEGSDPEILAAISRAFQPARLLDIHSDADHGRSVFTLAATQSALPDCLCSATAVALERIDLTRQDGLHPRVGALDVLPIVHLDDDARGAAIAAALTSAARIGGELGVPVFLYGALATDPAHRERADLRRGGPQALGERLAVGDVAPDFGPAQLDPRHGAVLVTARPPLVAFNLDLVTDDVAVATAIADELRESGGGLPGVRAIGLRLASRGRAQVSTNVHDPLAVPLAEIVAFVAARAPIAEAEIIGLAPRGALDRFPEGIPWRDFDPATTIIENVLDPGG